MIEKIKESEEVKEGKDVTEKGGQKWKEWGIWRSENKKEYRNKEKRKGKKEGKRKMKRRRCKTEQRAEYIGKDCIMDWKKKVIEKLVNVGGEWKNADKRKDWERRELWYIKWKAIDKEGSRWMEKKE